MKTDKVLETRIGKIILTMVVFLAFTLSGYSQNFSKLKITTKQGLTLTGKQGSINNEAVLLSIDEQQKSYPLSDIQSIMAKKGSAGKWALGFGGGCLALCLVTTVMNPNGENVGTLLLGSVIWTGIFAGLGGLLGMAMDPWTTVYFGQNTAFINRIKLNLDADDHGHVLVGLSYQF